MTAHPFKFLDAYEKEDKDHFFGRERETAQLFNAVHASNLILVYGASGTGKTSLIQCGLSNQFQDSDWLPVFVRRGRDLNDSLFREIDSRLKRGDLADSVSLPDRVRSLYLDHYRPIYFIFDQFEELFILGDRAEQATFYGTVRDLLSHSLQCKIIVSIREEYIALLNDFEKVVPSLFDNRLRIELMNDANLSRVVMGTARYGGIHVADPKTTVPAILDSIRDRSGVDLTNLQLYLERLWHEDRKRQDLAGQVPANGVTFDLPLVERVGKIENVLSIFLDEQVKVLEAELASRGIERPDGLPMELLFTLVTSEGTKRNMDAAEIAHALPPNRRIDASHVQHCLDAFTRLRLLRLLAEE